MEAFCEGQIWNTTLLLDNAWPHFTDCFIHTALVWIPCAFLFCALPYYVVSVKRNATDIACKTTALFGARLFCGAMLAGLSLFHVLLRICHLTLVTSPAAYLADALYIASYMTLCLMTQYERVKGVHTSTVPFFFWLMSALFNIIPLYTLIIEQRYRTYPLSFALFVMSHLLQVCSLVLTALVNNYSDDIKALNKKPCPETTCSFPSYLAFWWMTDLMIKGYKRDLQASDLWQLPLPEQSETLTTHFNKMWEREKHAASVKGARNAKKSSKDESSPVGKETSPLLGKETSQSSDASSKPNTEGEGKHSPRLLRTLLRMMLKDLCVIIFQKVLSDVFFLICPLLMGLLMSFLSSRPQGREWQGYALCLAMCGALTLKALLFAHSMFRAARLGIRMKSTLISAIYRKALTMNHSTKKKSTVGEIVNLMSVDAQRVQDVMIVCFYAATGPLQFVAAVALLYFTIGPAIFVGVLLLLCCIPLNAYVVSRQRALQSSNLTFKDARIRLFHEILNGIKVLKLYAWEPSFRERVREIRVKEVAVLFKMALLNTLMSLCWEMVPFLVTLVTFATYVLSDENNHLDASKAFVSLSLFNILRQPLAVLSRMIMYIIMVQVSMKRISNFLISGDLDPEAVDRDDSTGPVLSIQEGTFTWTSPLTPALSRINVNIKQGQLVAVVGPVGCGKSSLISAILGEMEKVKGTVTSRGRIAYVPQQAWIQNTTVRDNILFGSPYIRSKYKAILEQCELERDVAMLPAGDLTQIGEKGINLSGGQKQRVSVARAVYSDSDVYLLDDPLSAVDSHVGKAIFSKVIGPNGLLQGTTRVLVTHGVHWLPMVDKILVLTDGKISERGSYEELVSHDGPFAHFLKTYLTEVFEVEEQEDPEIAEIHGKMRERLGSVTSCASSDEDDSLKLLVQQRRGEHRAEITTDSQETSARFEPSPRQTIVQPQETHTRIESCPFPNVLSADDSLPGTPPRCGASVMGQSKSRGKLRVGAAVGLSDVDESVTLSPTSKDDGQVQSSGYSESNTTETMPMGKVNFSVFVYYAKAVGLLPFLLAAFSFCLYQALSVGANFWLKEWTRHPVSVLHANLSCPSIGCYPTNTTLSANHTLGYLDMPRANVSCNLIGCNTTNSALSASSTPGYPDANVSCNSIGCNETGSDLSANETSGYLDLVSGWDSTSQCLSIYGVLGIGQVLFLTVFNTLYWTRMARAARVLHARLADRLMHVPMSFFDTTPSGRVLNRLSFDVEAVDTTLPLIIRDWLVTFALVMVTVVVMVIQTPLSVVILVPVTVLYYFCQRFYVPTTRQLRRLECVTRSPIYVLFSETLGGAASIRAYDVVPRFLEESKRRVDSNQVFFFAYQAAIRWMQWNLDALSAVLVTAACVFTLTTDSTTAADAGLCISYALQVSGTLTWMTRQVGELQSNIVSVERLKEYSTLPTERDWVIASQRPPAGWPEKGEVIFRNFYTRYRDGLDLVLRGVTCTIQHGEKVGIVGRTGAGKSSLTLSLFRLIEAAGGSILIDGVNIADMGLHDLRSHLTILPQDPVLFSGSLRMNLDPFDEYSDSQLWTALDRAHLRRFVSSLPAQLHFQCGEEGDSLSVGQRQLVCLARTLLRRSRVLILDEATAAVDMETDALIQNTLRSAFSVCTVLTIAHRLHTILDYDKIMVMEEGVVKEFAPPDELLGNRKSLFFGMVRDAGLV